MFLLLLQVFYISVGYLSYDETHATALSHDEAGFGAYSDFSVGVRFRLWWGQAEGGSHVSKRDRGCGGGHGELIPGQ